MTRTTTTPSRMSFEEWDDLVRDMGLSRTEACVRMRMNPRAHELWRRKGEVPPWVTLVMGVIKPKSDTVQTAWHVKASDTTEATEWKLWDDLMRLSLKNKYTAAQALYGIAKCWEKDL